MEFNIPDIVIIVGFSVVLILIGVMYHELNEYISYLHNHFRSFTEHSHEFFKAQLELNINFDSEIRQLKSLTDRIADLEQKYGEVNARVYGLSFQTPNERCDRVEKELADLKQQVEDYNDVLLDKAMN